MIRLPSTLLALSVLGAAVAAVSGVAYYQFFAARNEPAPAASAPTAADRGPATVRRAQTPRPLPELHFVDANGNAGSLAQFRGRAVLLNIWATWCTPCREEMPALDRLQTKLGGARFDVVPLSIDRDGLTRVRQFYRDVGLQRLGIFVATDDDVMAKLGAVGVPLTLFVDRNGNEVWRRLGPAEWDQPPMLDLIRKEIDEAIK